MPRIRAENEVFRTEERLAHLRQESLAIQRRRYENPVESLASPTLISNDICEYKLRLLNEEGRQIKARQRRVDDRAATVAASSALISMPVRENPFEELTVDTGGEAAFAREMKRLREEQERIEAQDKKLEWQWSRRGLSGAGFSHPHVTQEEWDNRLRICKEEGAEIQQVLRSQNTVYQHLAMSGRGNGPEAWTLEEDLRKYVGAGKHLEELPRPHERLWMSPSWGRPWLVESQLDKLRQSVDYVDDLYR